IADQYSSVRCSWSMANKFWNFTEAGPAQASWKPSRTRPQTSYIGQPQPAPPFPSSQRKKPRPQDNRESSERGKNRGSAAAAMASGGGPMTKKELGETHDVLRFGVNDSVRGDLAPAHPVQATIHKEAKFWDEKKKFGTEAIYGSAFNIRRDISTPRSSPGSKGPQVHCHHLC
uniref:Uncharacterized protein n=1 Tax=Aegilops tauschii subsp. strangulata TaxID=200361 RepID=A0A453PXS9_AEGTS